MAPTITAVVKEEPGSPVNSIMIPQNRLQQAGKMLTGNGTRTIIITTLPRAISNAPVVTTVNGNMHKVVGQPVNLVSSAPRPSPVVIGMKRRLDNVEENDQPLRRARKRERLVNLTPEEKMSRRKLKNRIAAQTARDRKKEKMCTLEEQVTNLEEINRELGEENDDLRTHNDALLDENARLRQQLDEALKAASQMAETPSSPSKSSSSCVVHHAPVTVESAAPINAPPPREQVTGMMEVGNNDKESTMTMQPPRRLVLALMALLSQINCRLNRYYKTRPKEPKVAADIRRPSKSSHAKRCKRKQQRKAILDDLLRDSDLFEGFGVAAEAAGPADGAAAGARSEYAADGFGGPAQPAGPSGTAAGAVDASATESSQPLMSHQDALQAAQLHLLDDNDQSDDNAGSSSTTSLSDASLNNINIQSHQTPDEYIVVDDSDDYGSAVAAVPTGERSPLMLTPTFSGSPERPGMLEDLVDGPKWPSTLMDDLADLNVGQPLMNDDWCNTFTDLFDVIH